MAKIKTQTHLNNNNKKTRMKPSKSKEWKL